MTNCNQSTGVALHEYLYAAAVLIAAEINDNRRTNASLRQSVNADIPKPVGKFRLNLPKALDGLSNKLFACHAYRVAERQYRISAVIHRGHAEPLGTLGEGHGK